MARNEMPVLTSLGLRAAAVADLFASLARLLSPVLDVLIRLWLAEGFLVADVMQHMLGDQTTVRDHLPPSALLFASLAATGFGIFVQTICPVLLAAGLSPDTRISTGGSLEVSDLLRLKTEL
jgi:hypothetical protein